MRKQAIRTPRIAGPKMLWNSKMAFLCTLTWGWKQMGGKVFLLNQVKVKKLPKQAAAAEGIKLLLTKWAPQLRQAELCHIQRESMGVGSSSTTSLQNYTSNCRAYGSFHHPPACSSGSPQTARLVPQKGRDWKQNCNSLLLCVFCLVF